MQPATSDAKKLILGVPSRPGLSGVRSTEGERKCDPRTPSKEANLHFEARLLTTLSAVLYKSTPTMSDPQTDTSHVRLQARSFHRPRGMAEGPLGAKTAGRAILGSRTDHLRGARRREPLRGHCSTEPRHKRARALLRLAHVRVSVTMCLPLRASTWLAHRLRPHVITRPLIARGRSRCIIPPPPPRTPATPDRGAATVVAGILSGLPSSRNCDAMRANITAWRIPMTSCAPHHAAPHLAEARRGDALEALAHSPASHLQATCRA